MKHFTWSALLALTVLTGCTHRVSGYYEGLAVYEKNGLYGYRDRMGRRVIPAHYELARDFSEGMAYVRKQGKYGYIDATGKEVIPIQYDNIFGYVWDYGVEWTVVEQNDRFAFINRKGEVKGDFNYTEVPVGINNFENGYELVQSGGKFGVINRDCDECVPCRYDSITVMDEGLFVVQQQGLKGLADSLGNELIAPRYLAINAFDDGLAPVQGKNELWGLIDRNGKELCAPQFECVDESSEGLRWAQLPSGRGGYIDNTGAWAVPPRYDDGFPFKHGFAFVYNDKGYLGVVDAKGKVVVPFRYKEHILSKIEHDRIEMVTYHYYYPNTGTFIDNTFDAVLYENRQLSLQEGW